MIQVFMANSDNVDLLATVSDLNQIIDIPWPEVPFHGPVQVMIDPAHRCWS
jgi:hypothetical protein